MKQEDRKANAHRYDDIIDLPHHVSPVHPQMTMGERAAQFAPFAALTGHGAAIKETQRLTDEKIELDEDWREMLDDTLCRIQEELDRKPVISVTYFVKDSKKEGGAYVTRTGAVKKLDSQNRFLGLEDGTRIAMEDIVELDMA